MFELKIALKYLLPNKKSLTSTLVSMMSVLVISLVVWLVLVFLSVTSGIEKNWITKLTATHAPIRISPTPYYFQSYYYLIDGISQESNFTYKNISAKNHSVHTDPYDLTVDQQKPLYIPSPDKNSLGSLIDPVQELFSILEKKSKEDKSFYFQEYEIAAALMKLHIASGTKVLSQMSFLISIPDQNPNLEKILIPQNNPNLAESNSFARMEKGALKIPKLSDLSSVILPKTYKDAGAKVGDLGSFHFTGFSSASTLEQKINFCVVGFYDPGIMAVGNKCILTSKNTIEEINSLTETFSPDGTPTNGIFVWIKDLDNVAETKALLQTKLKEYEIDKFWQVTSYDEFEFAKDLLNQFKSDRTILLLVAIIILTVACSNIITLLVLLVNDKRSEIAILQAMGASSKSLACIFGFCGAFMGLFSCFLGSLLAFITLHNLGSIVEFLSYIQGRSAFNPNFFGNALPNHFSLEAFWFVLIATPIISIIAGLIPAIKACNISTAEALKSS